MNNAPYPIITIAHDLLKQRELLRDIAEKRHRKVLIRADNYLEHMTAFPCVRRGLREELGIMLVGDMEEWHYPDAVKGDPIYFVLEFWFVGDPIGEWGGNTFDAKVGRTMSELAVEMNARFGCHRDLTIADIKMLPPEAITEMVERARQTELDPLIHEVVLKGGRVKMDLAEVEVDCPAGMLRLYRNGGDEHHGFPIWQEDIEKIWEDM